MEMRTRPPWADQYLRWGAWTQDEFRNLLCGLPTHPYDDTLLPADMPAPTQKEIDVERVPHITRSRQGKFRGVLREC